MFDCFPDAAGDIGDTIIEPIRDADHYEVMTRFSSNHVGSALDDGVEAQHLHLVSDKRLHPHYTASRGWSRSRSIVVNQLSIEVRSNGRGQPILHVQPREPRQSVDRDPPGYVSAHLEVVTETATL